VATRTRNTPENACVRKGALRTWVEPNFDATLGHLGRPGERIDHQVGLGPTIRRRKLSFGYLIYEGNECEACASGGVANVELSATDGAFRVSRAWRERETDPPP